MSVKDAFRIVTDDSRVMLQMLASLPDDSRSIIYDRNMFIVQATEPFLNSFTIGGATEKVYKCHAPVS